MRRSNRKGYYFIIDALIGSAIIFTSLMIIMSGGVRPAKVQYNYEMAEEYNTFMMNTKIQDLSNGYVNNLTASSVINDTTLTIMEQVDLFYYRGDLTHARLMVQNISEPLFLSKYSFSYNIIDGSSKVNIYNRTDIDIADAKMVIASKKITFLQINSTTMFGPVMAEIKVWI